MFNLKWAPQFYMERLMIWILVRLKYLSTLHQVCQILELKISFTELQPYPLHPGPLALNKLNKSYQAQAIHQHQPQPKTIRLLSTTSQTQKFHKNRTCEAATNMKSKLNN